MTEYNIFPRWVDEEISVLGTDGAVAFVYFVFGKWVFKGHGETDGAAVAVCFVGCWLDVWSGVRRELLEYGWSGFCHFHES